MHKSGIRCMYEIVLYNSDIYSPGSVGGSVGGTSVVVGSTTIEDIHYIFVDYLITIVCITNCIRNKSQSQSNSILYNRSNPKLSHTTVLYPIPYTSKIFPCD